jgi:hypothetical protein
MVYSFYLKRCCVFLVVPLLLLTFSVHARKNEVIECDTANVLKVAVRRNEVALSNPEPSIEVHPITGDLLHLRFIVSLNGPILNSADEQYPIQTSVRCTAVGISVTAMITRSARAEARAFKNELWLPRIDVDLVKHKPQTVFEGKWLMRLDTGEVVHDYATAGVPSGLLPSYPIILKKRIYLH